MFPTISHPKCRIAEKLTILGVTFDAKCSWKTHIDIISKKAARRLFPLRLLKPYLDHAQLKTVYFGLMRSVLEYAAPLFVGLSKKEETRLQILQNRFHRLLCGKQCKDECLPALDDRRKQQAVILYCSILNKNHILHNLACNVSKRGRLILPSALTTRRLNSFAMKTAILYNELHSKM